MRLRLLAFASLACALAAAPPRPRLVVVVSVDQLSQDLVDRWVKDLPGGLGRLLREGTVFRDAYQAHAYTETGPGHSVILSGRFPAHTGITENRWLDKAGRPVFCVTDPASPLLDAPKGGASALHFRGTTLAQWLQDQVPGARAFTLTGKDRASILMTGPRANAVYWFEPSVGFTSSVAFAQSLPPWLQAHNRAFLGEVSRRSFYWEASSGQPEPGGTFVVRGRTQTFGLPRLVQAIGMPLDAAFWDRFKASPFLDRAILDAAGALVTQERLGQGPATDLLSLSLSSTDYVGHSLGNGGPEMRDQLRRLDQAFGAFLDDLRARVPDLWVVLTADHGCSDLPERLQAMGFPAKRLNITEWGRSLDRAVRAALKVPGDAPLFREALSHQLFLDEAAVRTSGRSRAEVLQAAQEIARRDPDVAEACTSDELDRVAVEPLARLAPGALDLKARIRLSYVPGRSGDLLLAFKAFVTVDDPKQAANHGHPHDVDRRVPLIFWGPWAAEARTEPVRIVDLAPTLARELGITPAEPVDGKPLDLHPRVR